MPKDHRVVLSEAEARIRTARERLAETGHQRRELQVVIGQAEESVSQELYAAGREQRDPRGIEETRIALAEYRQRFSDLERLAEGQERAVRDAVGARDAAMFANAPQVERELVAEAEALAGRRAEAETVLAQITAEEESLRGRWRSLAAVVPGASEPSFEEGEPVVPGMLPASRMTGEQASYVGEPGWPVWFRRLIGKETARV